MNNVKYYLDSEFFRFGLLAGSLLAIFLILVGWTYLMLPLMAIWLLCFIAKAYYEDTDKTRGAISSAIGQASGLVLVIAILSLFLDVRHLLAITILAFAAVFAAIILIGIASRARTKNGSGI